LDICSEELVVFEKTRCTDYLQNIALDLCDRAELYDKKVPLFDEYNIEEGPKRLNNLNALQGFTSKYMAFVIDLSS
jgi:hypothetical protein